MRRRAYQRRPDRQRDAPPDLRNPYHELATIAVVPDNPAHSHQRSFLDYHFVTPGVLGQMVDRLWVPLLRPGLPREAA